MPRWLRKLLGLIVNLDRINDLAVTLKDHEARAFALGTIFKIATALALLGCLLPPYFIGIRSIAGTGLIGDALQLAALIVIAIGLFALAEHHASREWPSHDKKRQFERRLALSIWLAFAGLYGPKLIAEPKPEPSSQSFFASEPFL